MRCVQLRCFNSYVVRLKVTNLVKLFHIEDGFNSYVVRLKENCRKSNLPQMHCFNSYVVRLKGVLQYPC